MRYAPLAAIPVLFLAACAPMERLLFGTALLVSVPPLVPLLCFLVGVLLASWGLPDYVKHGARSSARQAAEAAERARSQVVSVAHSEEQDGQPQTARRGEPGQPAAS